MRKKKHRQHHVRFDSITAGISITMVLILIGIVVFIASMANSIGRTVKENCSVDILLEDSLTTEQVQVMQQELQKKPFSRAVVYISKEEATRSMAEAYDDVNPQEFVGESPYPASFEVSLKAEYTESDSLARYMPPLKEMTGVTDVIYPEDIMDDINNNIRKISLILLIIAALLSVVSIALVNNTVRLNVARHRHSIQTMKLVGASWGFISRPFLLKALMMGLAAGLLADGMIYLGIRRLIMWDKDAASLITTNVMVLTLGTVAVCGLVLTMLSTLFSVSKHISMNREEAALY